MFDVGEAEYQCPVCRRTFPWRPEAAGRPVDCPCGTGLLTPFTPGLAERRSAEPGRELPAQTRAAEGPAEILLCADCGATMPAGTNVCRNCGWRRPRPKRRIFRRRENPELDETPGPAFDPLRDLVAPVILAGAGILIEIGLLGHAFAPPHNWSDAIAVSPLLLLLAAGTIVIAFLVGLALTPVLDLSLGAIGPLLLKLAAAVLFPVAIGALMSTICGGSASGIVIGWAAGLVVYLSIFRSLFDFEWPDAMLLIAMIALAQAVALFVVLWPLTHGPLPMPELWMVFHPVVVQSLVTFIVAGGLLAPHFRQ
jgi:ribosomal protein L40E